MDWRGHRAVWRAFGALQSRLDHRHSFIVGEKAVAPHGVVLNVSRLTPASERGQDAFEVCEAVIGICHMLNVRAVAGKARHTRAIASAWSTATRSGR